MKKRIFSIVLALIMVLGASSAAFAANQYNGMYSGITGDEKAVYVTDTFNKVIWKYANGNLTRFAGQIGPKGLDGTPEGAYVDASITTARFMEPWDIVPFLDGWAVSDAEAHVIRYIDATAVRTLAGSGKNETINGSGKGAAFMRPAGLAVDDKNNLYIADTDAGTIRMMDKSGKVTTYYSGLNEPTGICYSDGVLYICETGANRIVSIKSGSLSVVAGGVEGFADGAAASAKFAAPLGIAVAGDGTIIVSDTGNSAVRKIVGGRVYTLITSEDKDSNVVAPRGIYVTGPYAIITDNYSGELVVKSFESTSLFSDVADGIWYADAVNKAAEIRLVSGTGNGKFAPNLNFSRGELVTILSKIELLKDRDLIINGTSTFPDVASTAFYAKAVGWAAENGLVGGNQNGFFMPADNITRQDLATLLYKYAVKKNLTSGASADLSKFKDANEVLDYAKSAINWAVGIGIISGSDGMLNPRATATRAEAIKLIMNFVEYYNL